LLLDVRCSRGSFSLVGGGLLGMPGLQLRGSLGGGGLLGFQFRGMSFRE
jgi:hypothetical protein